MSTQLSDRVATRIQGLTLWTSGMKLHEVMKITGLTSYKIRKLYNTPEPPTPEPLTPLKDRITIFLQTPMKEVIPSPELGFIKRKTRRTKVAVVKTAASMRHKRLR